MNQAFELTINYKLVRKIADGGMGSVYEALQYGADGFEKRVAVKVLLPEYVNNKKYLEMFIDEAKLVATLVHENIVQLYHLGCYQSKYLIVMEYINGDSLDRFLEIHRSKNKTIPEELAVFIASRIARGLAYAHEHKDYSSNILTSVVHRDVSPRNILITSEGLPKLADFGLALVLQGEKIKASEKYLSGRLPYMAPEQAASKEVDRAVDVYALGAVLFELLTLQPIRIAENPFHQIKQAVDGEVRWELLNVKDRLKKIVARCLAVKPEDRFEKTSKLAEELERYIYEKGYGPTITTLKSYIDRLDL